MDHQIKLFGTALPMSPYGIGYLWFDSLSGTEKINELFEYQLIVKVRDENHNPVHGYQGLEGYVGPHNANNGNTPASDLNLKSLIGTEIAVRIRLDGLKLNRSAFGPINATNEDHTHQSKLTGSRFYHGLVNRVEVLPVRNRHATYKITLVPWFWLLTKNRNYRVFQRQSVISILREVIEPYAYPVDFRCSGNYDRLDFQVQYGESDYDFAVRLMQEHGMNFYFEHSLRNLTLVIADHNAAFKPMEAEGYQKLSIYPPNQRFPNKAEYIEFFEPAQQLVSGKVQLSDFQFKQPSLTQTAQDQFVWDHYHADREVYEWQQGDFISGSEGGEIKAKHRVENFYQHGYRATGKGHLKGLQTGFRFSLDNHPNSESNRDWLVLGTQTTIQDLSEERTDNQFYNATVEFLVQPDEQVLRPDRTLNKPHGRPQTAIVVGPEDEEIYTDEYGRVKVKFHWDRLGPMGDMVSRDGANSCWLRVSTGWAGNHFGSIHLPRIGQEVIVDFFNGDPDMPFVSGRLNNPDQMPIWQLPNQKALSGIKSKELKGEKSNQLVMDDTKSEIQIHLKSDHQSSELNLGHITRIPDEEGRKDYRGEGFELRTDGHGVLRAAKGLLVSTFARLNADKHVKQMNETLDQLKQATDLHEALLHSAITHEADQRDLGQTAHPQLAQQVQRIQGDVDKTHPELAEPQLVMASSSGVAITSDQTTHLTSKEHIALTSKKDISLVSENSLFASVSRGISLFAQTLGARLFAAKGKVEIHAKSDDLELIADKNIKVYSLKKKIEIVAAEEIMFNVNGNYIKIDKNGIEQGTQNEWVVYATQHRFLPCKTLSYVLPAFKGTHDEAFRILDAEGNALTQFKYKIVIGENEQVFRGETDENGFTSRINTDFNTKKVTIYQDIDEDEE